MEVFSEKILNLWNKCEVRVIILLSLSLQIILVTFGSRRKFTARSWIRIVVWSAYLTADWVASVALGNLAASTQADSDLQIFWAPFLLLHMGGPDTITAYSLEDNELWLRHLLGLVVQVGVALYVFLRSWSNSALTFIAIPIFITGIIKYGERTFVLRSSSAQQLKNSLLSNPDPGPNFIQMEKIEERREQLRQKRREEQGSSSWLQEFVDDVAYNPSVPKMATVVESESLETGASDLQVAYFLFKRFRYLFADSILGTHERIDSCSLIENKSAEDAFKVIATELGFMYDLLYTKATIVYSRLGIFFRVVSFVASVTALVLFSVIIDIHAYSSIDVSITYVLLIGAVVLEVYAFVVLLFSDWTALWYAGLRKTNHTAMCCATFPCHSILANRKRWSRSMAQYNLISSCLHKIQPRWFRVQKLPWIGDLLEKYQCLTWEDVNMDLEEMIFRQLVEKSIEIKEDRFNIESCRILLAKRGDYVLEKRYGLHDRFSWSTTKVEFDHSLLLWHIATDLCYYSDLDDIHGGDVNKLDSKCRNSKCLSDYMLYLLVFNPTMLPEGIGEIRYRDTLAEMLRFFLEEEVGYCCCPIVENREKSVKKNEACKALLQVNFGAAQENIKGDKSQSLLFYGCRLAKQLKSLEIDNRRNKWEVINEVWVEMLTYAANKCRWKEHGQQLRKGGELLTHVRLLMTHLGLSEQYRIQKLEFNQENVKHLKFNRLLVCLCIILCLPDMIFNCCRSLCCSCQNCFQKKRDTSQV
ncbi:hypothetical protein EZV62_003316 [Acer yangbiense]|uniref:DUF4220 domain-containing protein n=1 Tax=Acer yangbiense TaxID=1000413 RepID=A0A5C7IGW8_9ROSI|nr:hypothetical protein EZV62_003316 [Acer yangbiense]